MSADCHQQRSSPMVTGIGESGHVARKSAATMASIGKPAQFVHAAKANHGDLGMIGADDAIFAVPNSGKSGELADIIAYSCRFEIPLIAITAGLNSSLVQAADVVLLLPGAAEICPLGLAPATSPTMMAPGDELLERKGSSPADFPRLHPGGGLAASCCGSPTSCTWAMPFASIAANADIGSDPRAAQGRGPEQQCRPHDAGRRFRRRQAARARAAHPRAGETRHPNPDTGSGGERKHP